ncbi:MAG: type II toxin-antitoxin system HipA family toxin [Gemmatimonadetes bacterium]|nr:type II toxin-antitoxin system HipA family toxin [Gemmatimonadota bacterium]
MRKLEVRLDWGDEELVVGTLAEQERRVYFEYDAGFLRSPLPISPFKLPPNPGLSEHADRAFAGVFGAFADSLPDGWGLLLMDRQFRSQGLDPRTLTALDRLAYIGTRGMGALTYHPPAGTEEEQELRIDLDALARQAERVLEGSTEEVLPALRIAGGSPGGARPKVLVGVRDDGRIISGTSTLPAGFRHFLVKFGSKEDPADIGAVEAAYALMAASAGIGVPVTRLFETPYGRYFGAERFDREGNRRVHMHTLGGLLHASHRVPSMDYEGFLRATLMLTRDQRQVEEAFRRMVFNVLAHNRDDHVKNFSYLMDRDGAWRLAPAYDLVFSHGPGGEHTMAVAGEAAQPAVRDMLRVAEACDVDQRRARQVIEQVQEAVRQWPGHARTTGVSAATRDLIATRIGG